MSTITRLILANFPNSCKTIVSGVVEQLGIEIIPLCSARSCEFTSGTTSGTVSSILKAELSSIAIDPNLAAFGAMSKLTSLLAEINTKSESINNSSVIGSTIRSFLPNVIFLPKDFCEAQTRNLFNGKFRSSNIERNIFPTAPVAPITAKLKRSIIRFCYSNIQDLF